MQYHTNSFKEEETLANSFHEASITLVPIPDKDMTRKENCRPTAHKSTDLKILNKY